MAFVTKDLSVLAYANGFTLWHYTTVDAHGDTLKAGYFNGASDLMRVGDMVLVNTGDGSGNPGGCILLTTGNTQGVVTVVNLTQGPLSAIGAPAAPVAVAAE